MTTSSQLRPAPNNILTAWEMLAIEVLIEKAQKNGGFEQRSLEGLLKKVQSAKTLKVIK